MKLSRVTISGADDKTDLRGLVQISEEYPFVEWGLLCSLKQAGAPRYPSVSTLGDVIRFVGASRCSLHFCGQLARYAMGNHAYGRIFIDSLVFRRRVARVQLNGFSDYRLPMLAIAQEMPDVEFIAQCSTPTSLVHARELHLKQHENLTALWDASGGRGIPIGTFPCYDDLPMGYAGGFGPDNIATRFDPLRQNTYASWIDMESGVRTSDDRLDLDKVRQVLESAKPHLVTT